jgi:hypothetical protein
MKGHSIGKLLSAWALVCVLGPTLCAAAPPQNPKTVERTPAVKPGSEQTFSGLTFLLPFGYAKKDETTQTGKSPIPDNPPTTEYFRSYQDKDGHGIYLFGWNGPPLFDRGPMSADENWDVIVGSETAKVSLTNIFFGQQQHVLVAHFFAPGKKVRYLIYTNLVDKPAFNALLKSIRFANPQP